MKNDKADMDFLEIPADDAPQANVRPWPNTQLPKVFFLLKYKVTISAITIDTRWPVWRQESNMMMASEVQQGVIIR